MLDALSGRVGRGLRAGRSFALGISDRVGRRDSDEQLARDAESYWTANPDDSWHNNSHWRDGTQFSDDRLWLSIGQDHLELFSRLARTAGLEPPWGRVAEWGCGGGSNAVGFAPHAREFIGVDLAQDSLDECERQVASVTGASFRGVRCTVDRPENAIAEVGTIDVFLCLYVLELVPSPEYGMRLMKIARTLLNDGGVAFVQFKYRTHAWGTRARRRGYRRNFANMTTYTIDEFWTGCAELGLQPQVVTLVPRNEIDRNYAYMLLTKAS